ncbi:TatD family hydrolase [Verrucomicrobiaceae bacterium R5-34]|nr:TatD family hydrolase [Verrucomicrobiaceae bacterium R5-34]
MTDAHLHLQDARFDTVRDRVVAEMLEAGITRCVVNGTCPADWPKVAELAAQYPDLIIPSFGLHPWKKPTADWHSQLLHFLDTTPNAFLGECGLDRWIKDYDLDLQTETFTAQLEIAAERNLPLSIHCLKSWGPLIKILESIRLPERGFLLHSYGGSAELVPRLAALGSYFSFSGYFLQERKAKVLNAFRSVPSNRLLMETDAPDMLPPEHIITHPLPHDLNHPANLVSITKAASEHLDTSLISSNFYRFFTT